MLFYCDDTAALQQARAEEWLPLLPDWRGRQALGYRNILDQNLCAAAYLLLRYACAQNGFYELPGFQYGENGKPFFSPEGERLQFNLSHCCEGTACGIAKTAIGVDMQELVDDYEVLWDRVCSAGEKRWIRCSGEPVRAFTKLWAMKEAYVKCLGSGLGDSLPRLDFSAFLEQPGSFHQYFFSVWDIEKTVLVQCTKEMDASLVRVPYERLLLQS